MAGAVEPPQRGRSCHELLLRTLQLLPVQSLLKLRCCQCGMRMTSCIWVWDGGGHELHSAKWLRGVAHEAKASPVALCPRAGNLPACSSFTIEPVGSRFLVHVQCHPHMQHWGRGGASCPWTAPY